MTVEILHPANGADGIALFIYSCDVCDAQEHLWLRENEQVPKDARILSWWTLQPCFGVIESDAKSPQDLCPECFMTVRRLLSDRAAMMER